MELSHHLFCRKTFCQKSRLFPNEPCAEEEQRPALGVETVPRRVWRTAEDHGFAPVLLQGG